MQRVPSLLAALATAFALVPVARAQTTTVDVLVVDVSVTTTTAAPPAPVVVDEPAPSNDDPIVPILRARGEMLMIGSDYDFAAVGGSALIGARLGRGISGGLVVGYLSDLWDGAAEVNLGLELEKDFSPLDTLGFLLLARVGTAFMLDDGDPQHEGVRLVGQLGIGARIDVDPRVAITLDLRGVLRYRPGVDFGPRRDDVAGGAAITLGIAVRLD